jgi:hypothetical protein
MVWYAHHQDWDIWDTSRDNSIDHKTKTRKIIASVIYGKQPIQKTNRTKIVKGAISTKQRTSGAHKSNSTAKKTYRLL